MLHLLNLFCGSAFFFAAIVVIILQTEALHLLYNSYCKSITPWKSRSTIETIGFHQVDTFLRRESWSSQVGDYYFNSRLDFQRTENTMNDFKLLFDAPKK